MTISIEKCKNELDKVFKLSDLIGMSGNNLSYIINSASKCKVFIAKNSNKEIIGYSVVEIFSKVKSEMSLKLYGVSNDYLKQAAFLAECGVHPSYRGNNIQKRFIAEREKYSKSMKCTSVLVTVEDSNKYSKNNLINSGYVILGQRTDRQGNIRYLMRKELN